MHGHLPTIELNVCTIIPTKILSISMTVAMLGKFYQYKDNKGTNWPLYGNMQVMLSLGEGTFQCLLSIAL